MFGGGDLSDDTYDQQHQSYHSDQGPHMNSSTQSLSAPIKEMDIMNCMKLLQQQMKIEDIQQIDKNENDQAINFLNQYDTFNANQKQYMNNLSTQNQYDDSNAFSTKNTRDNTISMFNQQEKVSHNMHPGSASLHKIDFQEDFDQNNTEESDTTIQQNNQTQSMGQIDDEENILKRIHEMVEHYKSMSQMENTDDIEEQEGEIPDDTKDSKKLREEIKEAIFQNFLERNQYYKQQKETSLQIKRHIKNAEENNLQKKDFMSKKSRQICGDNNHMFKQSIGDRAKGIILKKQKDKLEHEMIVRYQETQECTFKPLLNPNSISDKYRSADEFYEDMQKWKSQKEHNIANIQMQCNLEKEEQERLEKLSVQVGLQLDPNSMRICEKKNINGDFLIRLEQDLDQRSYKKKQLELDAQHSFQPIIYENIRSPAIINQMKTEKANYRMQKAKEEQQTWNQFTSPISIKSKKVNTSYAISDNKKSVNNSVSYGTNMSLLNQQQDGATTPLRDKNNKVFTSVVQNQNKQSYASQSYAKQNAMRLENNSRHNSNQNLQNEIEGQNEGFNGMSGTKKNQFNSTNKYNSNSTKFTSIKSQSYQKDYSNNKRTQESGNQDMQYSTLTSNQNMNYESSLSNQKNQGQCSEFQPNSEQVDKEQFSSFIQQNLNKLKSTLNKMP